MLPAAPQLPRQRGHGEALPPARQLPADGDEGIGGRKSCIYFRNNGYVGACVLLCGSVFVFGVWLNCPHLAPVRVWGGRGCSLTWAGLQPHLGGAVGGAAASPSSDITSRNVHLDAC